MPTARTPRVRAIVLAAGAGRRFGGAKLVAPLHGRPVLEHVLRRLADAGLADPIVVVPPGWSDGAALEWGAAHRVVNPEPGRGLASSLRIGWHAALGETPAPEAVLVALGDQPLVPVAVLRDLASAALDAARPLVAPRWVDGGRNPVRIEATAGWLIDEAEGDRGLGPVMAAHPELVRWLAVEAANPDVDTRSDLERLEAL